MKSIAKRFPPFLKSYVRSATILAVKFFPHIFKNFVIPNGVKTYKDFDYITIYQSSQSKIKPPKTIYNEVDSRFLKQTEVSCPEAFVLSLQNGISTSFGANLTKSGILVKELSTEMPWRDIEKHRIFSSVRVFSMEKYNNVVATFTNCRQGVTYFHWLFNVLPKIHLVEKSGLKFDKMYIECQKRFQEETINLLGYKSEQIIDSSRCDYLSASQLIIPSLPDFSQPARITDWSCNFLRQKFLTLSSSKTEFSEGKHKRIYISRADTKSRRITNEQAVIHLLQKYDFSVIRLELLTFLEQVSLFKNAKFVIAPHGAGLSNIVFCSKDTKIIEIFSPKFINLCYWHLSSKVELDYYYLFGEGETINYYDSQFNNEDIEVDLNKLKNTFELASLS